ncbi:MAG TPA: SDR family NAD(P)-dependent oxidoreductase [Anaerolineae bacterium]|nr:SDR family NAD(P)-dependent oxidoreductase [Anaerolineae bacterium]HMR63701.1 SDR family NAD(P)-dependent oxidoreductase [Anaerolineae bacterium]
MKTAMVWGAGGGIGQALVRRLSKEDWTVIALTRRPADLTSLTPHILEADVASAYSVETAVLAAAQIVTEVDLWLYTAGDITLAKTEDLSAADWQRIINANLSGAFLATHYSLPLLASEAHLIYLGAINERLRLPGLGAYAAAKAGLEAFAEALSKEERQRKVLVVRPAAVETPLWEKVPLKLPKAALSPASLAEQILQAYQAGHQGKLDL